MAAILISKYSCKAPMHTLQNKQKKHELLILTSCREIIAAGDLGFAGFTAI